MGKLKAGKCCICGKPLLRHNEKRTRVGVAKKVYKEAHLNCYLNQCEGGL